MENIIKSGTSKSDRFPAASEYIHIPNMDVSFCKLKVNSVAFIIEYQPSLMGPHVTVPRLCKWSPFLSPPMLWQRHLQIHTMSMTVRVSRLLYITWTIFSCNINSISIQETKWSHHIIRWIRYQECPCVLLSLRSVLSCYRCLQIVFHNFLWYVINSAGKVF